MSTTKIDKPKVTRRKVEPKVVVEQIKVMPLWSKIALGIAAIGIIIMLYLYFSKPKPVVIDSNSHTVTQKAYNDLLVADSIIIATKDSIGAEKEREANFWKGVATERLKTITSNQQLYIENEKKYQKVISSIKPIGNLDSLRAAVLERASRKLDQ